MIMKGNKDNDLYVLHDNTVIGRASFIKGTTKAGNVW